MIPCFLVRPPFFFNMTTILSFFTWLYGLCKRAVEFTASIPGMITAAISSLSFYITNLFVHFPWTDEIVSFVDGISSRVEAFVGADYGQVVPIIVGWFAFDTLIDVVLVVLACTFGVVLSVVSLLFVSFLVLVPVIFGIRLIVKLIRIISLGYVSA